MTFKHLPFLLIVPLCCWGETTQPARDYAMLDVQNGLNCKLLDVGTTSFTFSVEWPLDMEIPTGTLDIFYKLHLDSVWSFAREIVLDPTLREGDDGWVSRFPVEFDLAQRKATFEIQYGVLAKSHLEKEPFEKQAFFHVAVPPADDVGWLGPRPEDEETETQGPPNSL